MCPSRFNMHSVMGNTGFGDLVIIKAGMKIHIPARRITKTGTLKKVISRIINKDKISLCDLFLLNQKYGVEITAIAS